MRRVSPDAEPSGIGTGPRRAGGGVDIGGSDIDGGSAAGIGADRGGVVGSGRDTGGGT
ncbi:hypothetical protein GCM10007298_10500 [Williamsia phyllosphaerae]|uniref:Uncharacterized protein n=1 Tax=Williamsia phyllosphaerae TaxID=885042 RepID=A0ABQ1UGX1_9NOCA|nr:hypothetical protein GCM10007298_10500 [Williamsia phyllosphaerae]